MGDNLKNYTCCFTGHRFLPENDFERISSVLKDNIIRLIKKDVKYFGTGGALGFDTLAALLVLDLKKQYKHIKLILVLPCLEQTKYWSKTDKIIYDKIKLKADKIIYISKEYTNQCMQKRNKHLVDNSGYCICYLTKNYGGTFNTVKYAEKNKLKIINIAN